MPTRVHPGLTRVAAAATPARLPTEPPPMRVFTAEQDELAWPALARPQRVVVGDVTAKQTLRRAKPEVECSPRLRTPVRERLYRNDAVDLQRLAGSMCRKGKRAAAAWTHRVRQHHVVDGNGAGVESVVCLELEKRLLARQLLRVDIVRRVEEA